MKSLSLPSSSFAPLSDPHSVTIGTLYSLSVLSLVSEWERKPPLSPCTLPNFLPLLFEAHWSWDGVSTYKHPRNTCRILIITELWTAFGIFLGTCANAVVKDVPDIAWRLQLGSAFIPALPLAIGIFFCPESPRWLMKKGRLVEAYTAMKKLRSTELQASRDLYYAYVQFAEEMKIVQGANYFTRLSEIFTIPRCRRATLAAGVVMIAQQMCGINIMAVSPIPPSMSCLATPSPDLLLMYPVLQFYHLCRIGFQQQPSPLRINRIRCP